MPSVSSTLAVAATGGVLAILAHIVLDNYGHEIGEALHHASLLVTDSDQIHQLKMVSAKSWVTIVEKGNSTWHELQPAIVSAQHKFLDMISATFQNAQHKAQSLFDKALHAVVVLMCKWALALSRYLATRYLDQH